MKKLIVSVALIAGFTSQAHAWGDREQGILTGIAAAVIIGQIANQNQGQVVRPQPVIVPQPVYVPPQVVYAPNPNYPQVYPYPRVITSSEPCTYYGQMVMTFDQFGRPIGYRNCR